LAGPPSTGLKQALDASGADKRHRLRCDKGITVASTRCRPVQDAKGTPPLPPIRGKHQVVQALGAVRRLNRELEIPLR
jgi:hypothetical protein